MQLRACSLVHVSNVSALEFVFESRVKGSRLVRVDRVPDEQLQLWRGSACAGGRREHPWPCCASPVA